VNTIDDSLPAWLREAMANPPPPPDPEEVARSERHARWSEVGPIRDRLPRFLATPKLPELEARIASPLMRKLAREWSPAHGNVLLLGETGQGKSTAAAVVFRRLLREGWRDGGDAWAFAQGMRWFRAEQLEREMRGHPLGRGECPAYRDAVNATLLVLDEIGWERDPKGVASILAERYDSPRLTIVTSGQDLKELSGTYGDAVVRRMLTHDKRRPTLVQAFPARDEERRREVASGHRPRPDQEELARRQGERL